VKLLILALTLASHNLFAASECIQQNDLKEIADHYVQFEKYVSSASEVCIDDMDEEFFKIAQSIIVLKNIPPKLPTFDSNDALTFQAIQEKDWWSYFTNRSERFSIDRGCSPGVIAYVNPFFGRGTINLCLRFFEMEIPNQASVMMHEVRHFDGFRHVTCTQGNETGSRGACDNEITDTGSYAISVQTMVGLARSKSFTPSETTQLESEAVYMAFNKFNKVPKVKLSFSMILANNAGEVYKWAVGQGMALIKTLSEPAIINGSERNLTLYPVDRSQDAYRMDLGLSAKQKGIGLFAESYNDETLEERKKYKSINYFGASGLLKGNTLLTLCNNSSLKLGEESLNRIGQFSNIINLRLNTTGPNHESYLLNEDGNLFSFECVADNREDVKISQSGISIDSSLGSIKQTLTLGFTNYAVLESGELVELNINKESQTVSLGLPSESSNWISASPITKAEVF